MQISHCFFYQNNRNINISNRKSVQIFLHWSREHSEIGGVDGPLSSRQRHWGISESHFNHFSADSWLGSVWTAPGWPDRPVPAGSEGAPCCLKLTFVCCPRGFRHGTVAPERALRVRDRFLQLHVARAHTGESNLHEPEPFPASAPPDYALSPWEERGDPLSIFARASRPEGWRRCTEHAQSAHPWEDQETSRDESKGKATQ